MEGRLIDNYKNERNLLRWNAFGIQNEKHHIKWNQHAVDTKRRIINLFCLTFWRTWYKISPQFTSTKTIRYRYLKICTASWECKFLLIRQITILTELYSHIVPVVLYNAFSSVQHESFSCCHRKVLKSFFDSKIWLAVKKNRQCFFSIQNVLLICDF